MRATARRWGLAGVALALALVAVPGLAGGAGGTAQAGQAVRPGGLVEVPLVPTTLVDTCNDGNPHAGPNESSFEIVPAEAARQVSSTPTVDVIQAGGAVVSIRVSATAAPGTIFVAGWTAVEQGCYSANGSVTYEVSLTAPVGAGGAGGARSSGDEGDGPPAGVVVGGALVALAGGLGAVGWSRRRRARLAATLEEAARAAREEARPDLEAWEPAVATTKAAMTRLRGEAARGADATLVAVALAVAELDGAVDTLDAVVGDDPDLVDLVVAVAAGELATLASLASGVHGGAARLGRAAPAAEDGFVAGLRASRPPAAPPGWHQVDGPRAAVVMAALTEARALLGVVVAGGAGGGGGGGAGGGGGGALAELGVRFGTRPPGPWLAGAARRLRVPVSVESGVAALEVTARLLTDPEAVLIEKAVEVGGDAGRLRAVLGDGALAVRLEGRLAPWRDAVAALELAAGAGGYAAVRGPVLGTPAGLHDVVAVAAGAGLPSGAWLPALRDGLAELARRPLEGWERMAADMQGVPAVRRFASERHEVLAATAVRLRSARAELDRAAGVVKACDAVARVDELAGQVDRALAAVETILLRLAHYQPMKAIGLQPEFEGLRHAVAEVGAMARGVSAALGRAQRACEEVAAVLDRLAALGGDAALLHPEATAAVAAGRDLLLVIGAEVVRSAADGGKG